MKYLLIIIILTSSLYSQDVKLRENYNTELSSIVGNLTSSNMFLIYLSQDLIYNSLNSKKISDKELKTILNSLEDISNQIDNNLKELYQLVESQKDAEFILKIVNVYEELKLSNKLLISYAEKKNDEYKEKYLNQRKIVWEKITEIK